MSSGAPDHPLSPLRPGWTTGSCATAAAKAAYYLLHHHSAPDPVTITLPGGQTPAFALARSGIDETGAFASIIKDAGDDPDVTHGAEIIAHVSPGPAGSGLTFHAGAGVGTVTRPGLPLAIGEPAINPVPRRMIAIALAEARAEIGGGPDLQVTISIPGGNDLAQRTLNPRLGIVGGLSILGTTGIVTPYSCAAWIHSIQRGIDVARAMGLPHLLASTGDTSERAAQTLLALPEAALIDMGDFVGGVLKYLRRHPVPHLTIAGGFAKMTKLGQGLLDLHSKRGQVDLGWLAERVQEAGGPPSLAEQCRHANSALHVLDLTATLPLGDVVARHATATAAAVLAGSDVALTVWVFDRQGNHVGQATSPPARKMN